MNTKVNTKCTKLLPLAKKKVKKKNNRESFQKQARYSYRELSKSEKAVKTEYGNMKETDIELCLKKTNKN